MQIYKKIITCANDCTFFPLILKRKKILKLIFLNEKFSDVRTN